MQCTNISVYKDVDDLDLYVGGLLEKNDGDSILGPVFKCIIGRQFRLLKKGDRFFYDLSIASNKKVAFNLEELNEVRSDCQQICFKCSLLSRASNESSQGFPNQSCMGSST